MNYRSCGSLPKSKEGNISAWKCGTHEPPQQTEMLRTVNGFGGMEVSLLLSCSP